jgi:hypothetical protein
MTPRTYLLISALAFTTSQAFAQIPDPMPSPGLVVPRTALPYALDHFHTLPELVPIHHSSVEVNNHKGANLAGSLTGGIFYKPKMTIEVAGAHARSVIHDTKPTFYLHMLQDPDGKGDTESSESDVFAIIKAVPANDRRVFVQVRFAQLSGDAKKDDGLVGTTLERLPGGWIRLTPNEPLPPGEYAISPVFKAQNTFATMVYDFSLAPDAPNAVDAVYPQR